MEARILDIVEKMQKQQEQFRTVVVIAIVIISLGCAAGLYFSNDAANQANSAALKANHAIASFKKESLQRRDESCEITEREHKGDVESLRKTYAYIESLSEKETHQKLNQIIIANLPETEQNARTDVAPSYCDEPGIGLPEPDPVLPKRRDYTYLLK